MRVHTLYEPVGYGYQPGTPGKPITFAYPEDKERMVEDIKCARALADVVIVWQHAGVVHVHAMIAMYQKEIAYLAIDAGADIVFQHHAHMLKGIETYKGKTIFYGLGNFAFEQEPFLEKRERREVEEYYGITIEPGWEAYPFPEESRNTIAVRCIISDKKMQKVTYLPGYINRNAQTEILSRKDERGEKVYQYIEEISQHEKLNSKFRWDGDEVAIQ
ncbi:CapA family protein [Chloroflexota bacterium]